jgi:hypothetical protein
MSSGEDEQVAAATERCMFHGRCVFSSVAVLCSTLHIEPLDAATEADWRQRHIIVDGRWLETPAGPSDDVEAGVVSTALSTVVNAVSSVAWQGWITTAAWGTWLSQHQQRLLGDADAADAADAATSPTLARPPPQDCVILRPAMSQQCAAVLAYMQDATDGGARRLACVLTMEEWADALLALRVRDLKEVTDCLVAHTGAIVQLCNADGDGVLLRPAGEFSDDHGDDDGSALRTVLRFKQRLAAVDEAVQQWRGEADMLPLLEDAERELRAPALQRLLADNELLLLEMHKLANRLDRPAVPALTVAQTAESILERLSHFGELEDFPLNRADDR